MKLYEFLLNYGISEIDFGYAVGCSASYVRSIAQGKKPSKRLIIEIEKVTDGKVKL
jgi:hypothetical protein